MTWHWRTFACVDDPGDVTRFMSETRATGLFPFPAIRDPRWDSALDALATALGLAVEPSRRQGGVRTHVDPRQNRRAAHVVYDAGASHAAWPIAAAYCEMRGIELGRVGEPEALTRWLHGRLRRPSSIAIWGVAKDFTFELVEACEAAIQRAYRDARRGPCLGYMVAADARQLLWLAFKTLVLWRAPVRWPDGFLGREDDEPVLCERPGCTRVVNRSDIEALSNAFDYLGLSLHGRGYEASLSRAPTGAVTICTHGSAAIDEATGTPLGPRCFLTQECFREEEYGERHQKVPINTLRARILFINSCASWRIGDAETRYSASLALRALDSLCTGYIGSRYEKPDDPRDDYRVLGAWKAGVTVGAAVKFASEAAAAAGKPPLELFSLVGDPEQARLQGRDATCRAARFGKEWAEIDGVRDGTIAVRTAQCAADASQTYRSEESGEWAVWLGDVERGESGGMSLYLFESARNGSWDRDVTLRRWPVAKQHGVVPPDADTGKWVTGKLLDTQWATGDYAALALGTWQAYGREYWPGPVAQYGDGEEGPCWGRSQYRVEGRCPGCGLETMRTTTPVSWRHPGSAGSGMVVVDVFCPRCYQVGFFPTEPKALQMPCAVLPEVRQGMMGCDEELVVSARFPQGEDEGALWIAVTPSERHVAALDPLPMPSPLWSNKQGEVFRVPGGCLLPGIHHVRTYFCREGDYALSAIGHMVQIV